jgi:hypothetical protein
LTAPWFMVDKSTGISEVVCTLKGAVLREMPADSPLAQIIAEDDYCPVIQLVDMANSVLNFDVPVCQSAVYHQIGLVDQTAEHQHTVLHYSAYSTRAPPFIS